MQIKKNFIIFILMFACNAHCFFFSPLVYQPYSFTLMIDPAGDAQTPGRVIDNCYERTITLQLAQQLKEVLEHRYSGLRCILTRDAGDIITPLQNAHYANRMNVDLYISIHCYAESQTKPNVYLYTFSNNDDLISLRSDMQFYPYDQIHRLNREITKKWSVALHQALSTEICKKIFNVQPVKHIPFKPLIGIKSPAIAFEIGLKTKDDWQEYIELLAMSLHPIITQKN